MSKLSPSSRGNPYQSKLEPFADLIRDWRRRRKSYRLIAQILRDEHGIAADHTSIWSYVKVRSRSRPVYSMTEDTVRKRPNAVGARPDCPSQSEASASAERTHFSVRRKQTPNPH